MPITDSITRNIVYEAATVKSFSPFSTFLIVWIFFFDGNHNLAHLYFLAFSLELFYISFIKGVFTGIFTRRTPAFLLAMLVKTTKRCRVYTLRFTRYTLEISNFCERVHE